MNADEIPQSIFRKHPEIVQVFEAIESYRMSQPITTRCRTCNQLLKVVEVPAASSLWVNCGNGCTTYRERYRS